jgi:hypothetical protein
MFIFRQPHEGHGVHIGYKGALALGALLWLILSFIGCSSSRKEYVWIIAAVTMRPLRVHASAPARPRGTAGCWLSATGCVRIGWCISEGNNGLTEGQEGDLSECSGRSLLAAPSCCMMGVTSSRTQIA